MLLLPHARTKVVFSAALDCFIFLLCMCMLASFLLWCAGANGCISISMVLGWMVAFGSLCLFPLPCVPRLNMSGSYFHWFLLYGCLVYYIWSSHYIIYWLPFSVYLPCSISSITCPYQLFLWEISSNVTEWKKNSIVTEEQSHILLCAFSSTKSNIYQSDKFYIPPALYYSSLLPIGRRRHSSKQREIDYAEIWFMQSIQYIIRPLIILIIASIWKLSYCCSSLPIRNLILLIRIVNLFFCSSYLEIHNIFPQQRAGHQLVHKNGGDTLGSLASKKESYTWRDIW